MEILEIIYLQRSASIKHLRRFGSLKIHGLPTSRIAPHFQQCWVGTAVQKCGCIQFKHAGSDEWGVQDHVPKT